MSFIIAVQLQPISFFIAIVLLLIALLLISSALFSGSEVAYFSLKPKEIEEIEDSQTRSSKLIIKHLKESDYLLATILISNNFVNVGIVMLSAYVAENIFIFDGSPTVQFIFEAIVIAGLILFFGEILPKVYAGLHPKKVASLMAYPLLILKNIFKPLSSVLVKSTNIVNKRLAKKMKGLSMDDISQALDLADDEATESKEILKGIVNFGNILVSEIMTSRIDIEDLDFTYELSKVLSIVIESGYSRFPVFDDGPDNVKGILYVKDLLPHLDKDNSFKWQKLIRQAYYVPENKKLNDLLKEFKTRKNHMAIVVDEYGGTAGIITLEDILEEIVGDISDELDDEDLSFITLPDGSFLFEAKTQIKDFLKITNIPEDAFDKVIEEAETIAGMLLELRGEIPIKNEIIEFKGYKFTIMAADQRRIKKVKFSTN